MSIQTVSIRTSTRGKNPRILTYEGIGKVTPFDKNDKGEPIAEADQTSKSDAVDVKGVVTNFKEFVELVKALPNAGDGVQLSFDMAANGYNLYVREQLLDTDEFDGLLDGIDWVAVAKKAGLEDGKTEKGKEINAVVTAQGTFKRMARAQAGLTGMELADVVQFLATKLPKLEAVAK